MMVHSSFYNQFNKLWRGGRVKVLSTGWCNFQAVNAWSEFNAEYDSSSLRTAMSQSKKSLICDVATNTVTRQLCSKTCGSNSAIHSHRASWTASYQKSMVGEGARSEITDWLTLVDSHSILSSAVHFAWLSIH